MRIVISAIVGIVGAALLAPTAGAFPAVGQGPVGVEKIVPVAEGCGPGRHWVDRYRDRYGRWIPGHCVPN